MADREIRIWAPPREVSPTPEPLASWEWTCSHDPNQRFDVYSWDELPLAPADLSLVLDAFPVRTNLWMILACAGGWARCWTR